jgi:Flp pilus assembly protein TadG
MLLRSRRLLKNESGLAAIEFAILLPVLAVMSLSLIDGWSLGSSMLSMRASVNTAANLLLQGVNDDQSVQATALASWGGRPSDGQITLTRIYKCGSVVVTAGTICSGAKAPAVYVNIKAKRSWVAPYKLPVFSFTEINHEQVIRVR